MIDDDRLDEEFPLGDGTADTERGRPLPLLRRSQRDRARPGRRASQEYVEDCQVCCRPWTVYVSYAPDGAAEVSWRRRTRAEGQTPPSQG